MVLDSSISVVIPTYRRPQLVGEAVASALGQGAMVKEVIVIDDCPDGSAAVALASVTDGRLVYRRNPIPSGGRPGLVRNLGWALASGSVLHFLDDDDRVPANHYRAGLDALSTAPEVGVVFGRVEPFGPDASQVESQRVFFEGAARRSRARSAWGSGWGLATEMTFNPVLYVGGAALIRRSCVQALGGFDEQMRVSEDTDLFARAMSRYGARFLDRVALEYRIGPSITRSDSVQDHVVDGYRRMHDNCRNDWGRARFLARKIVARTFYRAARG